VARLRVAIEELEAADLGTFVLAAKRNLGLIVGGEEGAELLASVQAAESVEGIVAGDAFARLHAPGFRRLFPNRESRPG
jgi:hypothetical protein